MFPKRYIQLLNLRRELNRRLLFVKQRMKETQFEHRWIEKKIEFLPRGAAVPPEWAILAAKRAWEKGFAHAFDHLTPDAIREDPRGCIRELQGIYEGLVAYVHHPTPEEMEKEERVPALKELRKSTRKTVGKKFLKYLRGLDARLEKLLPGSTQQGVIDLGERYIRGAKSAKADDGILGMRTVSAKIYYLVWFFWPRLARWPRFRATDLEDWLAEELGIFAGIKTVEAVHTDLRIAELWTPHQPNSGQHRLGCSKVRGMIFSADATAGTVRNPHHETGALPSRGSRSAGNQHRNH